MRWKWTAFIATILLCLSASVAANAEYGDYTYGDLYYDISEEGIITITDCDEDAVFITIPSSIDGKPVTAIDDGAFNACGALEDIYIPDSIESIGAGVFLDCKALNSISISQNSSNYKIIDGVLYSKDGTGLILAPRNISGEYTILDGTERICSTAFDCCYNLTRINFPQGIKYIERCAFSDCTKIKKLVIPFDNGYSVEYDDGSGTVYETYIGSQAFYGCTALESVSIPITYSYFKSRDFWIAEYAFMKCTNLKKLYLPNALGHIDMDAFMYCDNIKNIYFEGDETEWGSLSQSVDEFQNASVCCDFPPYSPVSGDNYEITVSKDSRWDEINVYVKDKNPVYGGQTLYFARYDENGVFMNLTKAIIGYGENDTYISLGFPINGAAKVKAFIWNNEESMTPASNAVSLDL